MSDKTKLPSPRQNIDMSPDQREVLLTLQNDGSFGKKYSEILKVGLDWLWRSHQGEIVVLPLTKRREKRLREIADKLDLTVVDTLRAILDKAIAEHITEESNALPQPLPQKNFKEQRNEPESGLYPTIETDPNESF
jgi:hypothetical protein